MPAMTTVIKRCFRHCDG